MSQSSSGCLRLPPRLVPLAYIEITFSLKAGNRRSDLASSFG